MRTRSSPVQSSEIAGRIVSVLEGISYRQAERVAGVSRETIRRMMNGGTVTVPVLAAFCQGFGVSADWLLFGTGKRTKRRR